MGRVDAAMAKAAAARRAESDEHPAVAVAAPPVEREQPPARQTASPTGVRVEDLDAEVSQKIVVDQRILAGSREQYRRLAAGLHQAQATTGIKVVMISSALPGEGKTLTSSNLSLTLSESYHRRVLLIDADLRRPSLHRLFKVPGSPGFTDCLRVAEDRAIRPHQISSNLSLLVAGTPSADPMAVLTSTRIRRILDDARETFDWVIVDTPPIGLLPDAGLVAANVDATLLVVKAGETPFELVKRAVDAVGSDRLLGVVLNRTTADPQRYGYSYSQYAGRKAPIETPETAP